MTDKDYKFIIGLLFLVLFIMVFALVLKPEWTLAYKQGVRDTKREAFEQGFMVKEVDKEDNVIYRWIEPHKYNEKE